MAEATTENPQPDDGGDAEYERTDRLHYAILKSHCVRLLEHFDSIQIVATRHSAERGSHSMPFGGGNWYARYGSTKEWVTKQDEQMRIEQRPVD